MNIDVAATLGLWLDVVEKLIAAIDRLAAAIEQSNAPPPSEG